MYTILCLLFFLQIVSILSSKTCFISSIIVSKLLFISFFLGIFYLFHHVVYLWRWFFLLVHYYLLFLTSQPVFLFPLVFCVDNWWYQIFLLNKETLKSYENASKCGEDLLTSGFTRLDGVSAFPGGGPSVVASRDLFLGMAAFLLAPPLGIQSYKHCGVTMCAGVSGPFLSASPDSCLCVWLQLLGPTFSSPRDSFSSLTWNLFMQLRKGVDCGPSVLFSGSTFTTSLIFCTSNSRAAQSSAGVSASFCIMLRRPHPLPHSQSPYPCRKKERLYISYQLFCLTPFSSSLEIYTFFFSFQWGFWKEWR